MLNKPRGCITACSDARHKTVMDLISPDEREGLFPIGRLDRDTEGFLILTDDGALCNALNSPKNQKDKTYRFYAKGEWSPEAKEKLNSGVNILPLGSRLTAPARSALLGMATMRDIAELFPPAERVRLVHTRAGDVPLVHVELTVTEGKKHQVKRMAAAVGLTVVYLERVAICGVPLDPDLKRGEYRPLTDEEISIFKA